MSDKVTHYLFVLAAVVITILIVAWIVIGISIFTRDINCEACVEPLPIEQVDGCIDVYYVRASELISTQLCNGGLYDE